MIAVAFAVSTVGYPGAADAQGARKQEVQERDNRTSMQKLDTVHVVTGARSGPAARSVTVISRNEILARAARSVADVIAWELGTDLMRRSPAQSDLSIRGSGTEQVLILVDGVRVSDRQTGHFNLDLAVPLPSVQRIEILRGAGSSAYGTDAVGGVVNIITRSTATEGSNRPAGEVAVHAGSFGTQGASALLRVGSTRLGTVAAFDHERSEGHRADTDYGISQMRLTATGLLSGNLLRADFAHAIRDFGAANFYTPYPSHERTGSSTATFSWEPLPFAGWSIDAVAGVRRHDDVFTLVRENPSIYQNEHVNWQSTLELTARRSLRGISLALGAEGMASRLRSERLGNREATMGALYGEASTTHGRAGMNVGLRADWSSENRPVVSPSIATSLAISPEVLVRLNGSHGFRAPSWTDRFYSDPSSIGDPDLKPEDFWTGEVGFDAKLRYGFELDATAWSRRARDLIDWARPVGAPADEVWHARNVARATFTGIESELGLPRFDLRGAGALDLSLRGSAIRLTSADAEGWAGRYSLRPLNRSILTRARFSLGGDASLMLDAGVSGYAGEKAHSRADARFTWSFRAVRFTLDALNLTDADYADATGRPAAGRSFHLGAAWLW